MSANNPSQCSVKYSAPRRVGYLLAPTWFVTCKFSHLNRLGTETSSWRKATADSAEVLRVTTKHAEAS